MKIGSLFSGIGGLELGLERAGLGDVIFQCEIDPFCRSILAKHWPHVERFEDVTQPRRYPSVDLICGGFPCTDVSSAGKRRGLGGQHSGLWYHFAGVIRQVRPRFVVVENVASGTRKWLPTVRRDLHMLGYGSTAIALSAADVGAPHLRRRVFVVAYPYRDREFARAFNAEVASPSPTPSDVDGDALRNEQQREPGGRPIGVRDEGEEVARLDCWRDPLPDMVRSVHGVSRGLDGRRRKALGNSVIPSCAEVIGRMIREAA